MHLGGVGQPGADGVDVGIDQAGNDGAAAEIDDAGRGTGERADVGRAADRRDFSVAHRQRLRGRRVIDDDLAVDEDGVGGLSVSGTGKCEDAEQQTQPCRESGEAR